MKPFFATPAFGGQVTVEHTVSLIQLLLGLEKSGVPFAHSFLSNESLITRARNECVGRFLQTDCTHLFFLDADVGFEAQAAVDSLYSRLDFVVGAYPLKDGSDPMAWAIRFCPADVQDKTLTTVQPFHDSRTFLHVMAGGGGFMCLSRAAVTALCEGKATYRGGPRGQPPIPCFEVFRTRVENGECIGEDFDLCLQWSARGGKVWCNVGAKLTHKGTKTYAGDFAGRFAEAIKGSVQGPPFETG
jgi:hypothetical protein